ncbi:hypothetical protein GCM10007425_01740 [Lysinibacillus alkalisoli]|uniref:Uncharacterized protein n=2 Tax=Lysinibacillus alkalisoli TaxID=1911548 RepID=A0A917FUX4_9BACI|nr:hypothetical protein GCM10007425_01740 [Lysinibacillus alkalisoli]
MTNNRKGLMPMLQPYVIIQHLEPRFIVHNTYKRECQYFRYITLSVNDLETILYQMNSEDKTYFEFHNAGFPITQGTLLNGHARLAHQIYIYLQREKNISLPEILNGKDFYIRLIA